MRPTIRRAERPEANVRREGFRARPATTSGPRRPRRPAPIDLPRKPFRAPSPTDVSPDQSLMALPFGRAVAGEAAKAQPGLPVSLSGTPRRKSLNLPIPAMLTVNLLEAAAETLY